MLLLSASSPSDSSGGLNEVKKDLVDDGTSIFTIIEDVSSACPNWAGSTCFSIADTSSSSRRAAAT